MSFGLNRAEVIGRLGADVTVNHLASGGRVANMSVATDESYIDRNGGGERIDKTEWHRCVTFQDGLIDMLEKHAKKGRLVYVAGKMQTRRFRKDGEDSDRFSTEILLVPGGRVQFLDKPNGANGNGAPPPPPRPPTVRPRPPIRTIRSPSRDRSPSFLPPNSGAGASALAPFLVRASSLHRRPGRPAAATVSFRWGIFSLTMRTPPTAPFCRRSWLCTCSTVAGLRSG